MSNNKQMDFNTRHKQILDAAKKLVKGDDLSKVTCAAVARACGCTAPLVFAHFRDRDELRAAVRNYIKTGKVTVQPKVAVTVAKPKVKIAVVKAIKNKTAAAKKPAIKVAAAKKAAPKAVKKAKAPAPKKPVIKPAKSKAPAAKKAPAKSPAKSKTPVVAVAVSSKLAPPPAPTVAAG